MKVALFDNKHHIDSRGEFQRLFDLGSQEFERCELQQVNISKNPKRLTLRGMHYQVSGPPENKFVTVIKGHIRLVVSNAHLVLTKNEVRNLHFDMSEESRSTLLIPSGLATGWISLTENVEILYMMTSRYEDCDYSGFRHDDPFASILWPSTPKIISKKDQDWPLLR